MTVGEESAPDDAGQEGLGRRGLMNDGKHAEALSARKKLVPEKPEAVWLRTKVVISFWAVVLLLGIPVWWQTTSIYRARLPIQAMTGENSRTSCHTLLPLEVWLFAPNLVCEDALGVVEVAQSISSSIKFLPAQPIRIRLANSRPLRDKKGLPHALGPRCYIPEDEQQSGSPALKLHLLQDQPVAQVNLTFAPFSAQAYLRYNATSSQLLGSFAAEAIYGTFTEERTAVAQKLATEKQINAAQDLDDIHESVRSVVTSRENRALKYASTYHLTFSLFTPGGSPSSWAIGDALKTYINPWLDAFGSISNFSTNTQVQPYSAYSPSIQSFSNPGSNQTSLRREDLSAFINAAEWPLSPSIGSKGPNIHFVLYVPSASEVPLTIDPGGEISWLIPQWGGVAILNPTLETSEYTNLPSIPRHLDLETLHPVFETFTKQLLSLLGLPDTPQPQIGSEGASSPTSALLPLPMRLQSLTRLHALNLHLLTRSTLSSLAHLSTSLPNIPIPRSVATQVATALSKLEATCTHLAAAEWDKALACARTGWEESEKAFFEKSMVGQVYFPDEHKVAVYLPLLGPVGVPLLMALFSEIKGLVRRRRGSS